VREPAILREFYEAGKLLENSGDYHGILRSPRGEIVTKRIVTPDVVLGCKNALKYVCGQGTGETYSAFLITVIVCSMQCTALDRV